MFEEEDLPDALLRIGRQLESAAGSESPELVEGIVELNLYNSQNTLLIDLERCTRCDACVKAWRRSRV